MTSWAVDGTESFLSLGLLPIFSLKGVIRNALGECAVSRHFVISWWILCAIPKNGHREEAGNIAFDGKWDEMCEFRKERTSATDDSWMRGMHFCERIWCFINPAIHLSIPGSRLQWHQTKESSPDVLFPCSSVEKFERMCAICEVYGVNWRGYQILVYLFTEFT